MPMPKDFADWYRAASIAPSPEMLEQRWLGVEAAATKLAPNEVVTLLKLFCIRTQAGKTPDFLDAAFRAHDVTFPTSRNQEELRVLSGAILREAIEIEHSAAISAALGLICGSFGRRTLLPTPEHVVIAEAFLARIAIDARQVAMPKFKARTISKERFDELMPATVFQTNQTPNARDPLFNTLSEQTKNLASDISRHSAAIWKIIQAQREELDILWWLQSRFSRQLNRPLTDLSATQACLAIATELADLTVFTPGSGAILGVMITALNYTKKSDAQITILDAVKSSPRYWREALSTKSAMGDIGQLCPVFLAISKSLETEGETDWVPVYRRYSDVSIDVPVPIIDVSYELYHELLFSRAIVELSNE